MLGTPILFDRFVHWEELGTDLGYGSSLQSTIYLDSNVSGFIRMDILHTQGAMFSTRVWRCDEQGTRVSQPPLLEEEGLTREEALEFMSNNCVGC